jgi:TatD DNase family protein
MRYFDAHCHVQFPMYDDDREEVIARMQAQEMGGLVVGVDYDSTKKAIALAEMHDHLFASVGLHPNDVALEEYDGAEMERLATDPKVVAIGECGLDYFRPEDPGAAKQKQKEAFEQHIALAVKTGKPLMIHARPSKGTMDAYEDALALLESAKQEHPELRGDFHFFVGDIATAARIVALDFTISYTAVLTFARDYDEVVRSIPLTHIISETDAPYAAPAGRRGQRNDPLAIPEIVAAIARIREEDEEVVRAALLENTKRLFRI